MTPHRDALESFNRATFDPPTPEISARMYRGWLVEFDPKPIPCRNFDWTATGPNYDAWFEDGQWTDNAEKASADSREALEAEIDRMIDHPMTNAFPWRLAVPMGVIAGFLCIAAWAGAVS